MGNSENAQNFEALVDVLARRYRSQVDKGPIERRVVLVIGAGASLSSDLPLWSDPDLRERVLQVAEGHYPATPGFVAAAWERSGPRLGLPPAPGARNPTASRERLRNEATLEELCAIACDDPFLRDKVLKELVKWFAPWDDPESPCDGGPPPQLAYELLAHLLKHRFVDHVISFNFDELLDTAVANELAPDDYVRITSDHHVLVVEKPIKPHLIKIHGTISQPETLRFTAAQTGALTRNMVRLLNDVVWPLPAAGKSLQLDVISLGYSWLDKDFAHYIYGHRMQVGKVIAVMARADHNKNAMIRFKNLYPGRPSHNRRDFPLFVSSDEFVRGRTPTVDLVLWAAWNKLVKQLEGKYAVMSAERHVILAGLFARDWSRFPREEADAQRAAFRQAESTQKSTLDWIERSSGIPHTRDNRFRAEMLLHAIECKGMVNVSVMANNCRLHRYCPKKLPQGSDIIGTMGFLTRGESSHFKETYYSGADTVATLESVMRTYFPLDHDASVTIRPFLGKRARELTFKTGKSLDKFLGGMVGVVFDGEEVEVVPSADRRSEWTFVNPKPLATYLQMQTCTAELLESKKGPWTHLFVIAETGAWMRADRIKKILKEREEPASILCIDTRTPEEWKLREEIARRQGARRRTDNSERLGKCDILYAQLHWWQHNRHLTLAYNEKIGRFVGGIYFRRHLRSTQIAPVWLHDSLDCAELFVTFLSYAQRVCEVEASLEEPKDQNPVISRFLRTLTEFARKAQVPAIADLRDDLCSKLEWYQERFSSETGHRHRGQSRRRAQGR